MTVVIPHPDEQDHASLCLLFVAQKVNDRLRKKQFMSTRESQNPADGMGVPSRPYGAELVASGLLQSAKVVDGLLAPIALNVAYLWGHFAHPCDVLVKIFFVREVGRSHGQGEIVRVHTFFTLMLMIVSVDRIEQRIKISTNAT